MKQEEVSLDKIIRHLTVIMGGPRNSACACIGIACGCTACYLWWEQIFNDQEIKQKFVDWYLKHQTEIETGAKKLLVTSFLKEQPL